LPKDVVTTDIATSGGETSTSENPPEIQYQRKFFPLTPNDPKP